MESKDEIKMANISYMICPYTDKVKCEIKRQLMGLGMTGRELIDRKFKIEVGENEEVSVTPCYE